jgi:putative transcriptional regulator
VPIVNRIPELMARRRWHNITDLARAMGCSNFTAGQLYHGRGKGILFATLEKLCQVFEVGVGDIFYYTPDASLDSEDQKGV